MFSQIRIATTLAIGATLLTPALLAQGIGPSVFQFDRDYHFGEIGTIIPGPLSTSPAQILAGRGTLSLRKDLTFSVTELLTEVTAGGSVVVTPDNGGGVYRVDPDSVLILDDLPANPNNPVDELPINRSGTILMATRGSVDEESIFAIALQVASGLDNTALKGKYSYVNQSMEYNASSLSTSSVSGTITFDGAGNFQLVGNEQVILPNGQSSISPINIAAGYQVAADGTLTVPGTNLKGAVAQDSDVFFLVDTSSTSREVGLSLGVRLGQNYTRDMVEGSWAVHVHELEVGVGPGLPNAYTEDGSVNLVGTSAMAGTYAGMGFNVDSNPTGVSGGNSPINGTWKLKANGAIEVLDISGPPATIGAISANGELMIASEQLGVTELVVLLKTCDGSENYGTGTAGSGGLAPEIGMRGFPTLGNTSFELGIVNAIGGSSAVMPIATQATPVGIPFLGGQIWVNPASILVSVGVAVGGSAGVAGDGSASLTLPIPAQASLVGLALYSQGIVLDPSAPVGLSMTGGFKLEICR